MRVEMLGVPFGVQIPNNLVRTGAFLGWVGPFGGVLDMSHRGGVASGGGCVDV